MIRQLLIPFFIVAIAFTSCDKNNNLVLFSVQDDVALGEQVSEEINNDPQFRILAESQYPFAYNYINSLTNQILDSDDVAYREEFVWEVKIIENDSVLNAFATPGGYIYVYTGLIKYLESADALAGVMAHEIAHSDLRHTSRNLQKAYGVSILLSIIFGENPNELETIAGQIAGTLSGLRFSRDYEREADDQSVQYLADTPYACNGAAIFFEKLNEEGQTAGVPEFLSTHPSPDNRIQDINQQAEDLNCATDLINNSDYQNFQNSLPN